VEAARRAVAAGEAFKLKEDEAISMVMVKVKSLTHQASH